MEPILLASSFATIVGLIGMFKREMKEGDASGINEFLRWLESHKFDKYAKMISNSSEVLSEIEKVLTQNHEVVISKLDKIDGILSTLSKNIGLLRGLANSIHQSSGISNQAIDVLRQLARSRSNTFMKHKVGANTDVLILMQGGGNIIFNEPRFIDDDLNALVHYRLLTLSHGSGGSEIYRITRNGDEFIGSIDN